MSGNPPERGLWRELLDLAVGTVRRFDLGGRTWPAAAVWSVGATLYLSADKAGMIRTLTEADLARLCRLDERTVRAALVILRRLRVAKCSRPVEASAGRLVHEPGRARLAGGPQPG